MKAGVFLFRVVSVTPVVALLLAGCDSQDAATPKPRVVCFGDSLSRGYGAGSAGYTYPERLQKLLGPSYEVVNAGRDGDTTNFAIRERLKAWERPGERPDIIVVELGGNDTLKGVPLERTLANLQDCFDRMQAIGARVIFLEADIVEDADRWEEIRKLCRREKVQHVPGILRGIAADPELMADKLHPNAAGYRLLAERVHSAIVRSEVYRFD